MPEHPTMCQNMLEHAGTVEHAGTLWNLKKNKNKHKNLIKIVLENVKNFSL